MTQTGTAAAAVTLAHLATDPTDRDWLALIDLSKTELDALAAGMHNQAPDARALQNAMWSAQNAAQQDIVLAALQAGVKADVITAITHRESW